MISSRLTDIPEFVIYDSPFFDILGQKFKPDNATREMLFLHCNHKRERQPLSAFKEGSIGIVFTRRWAEAQGYEYIYVIAPENEVKFSTMWGFEILTKLVDGRFLMAQPTKLEEEYV